MVDRGFIGCRVVCEGMVGCVVWCGGKGVSFMVDFGGEWVVFCEMESVVVFEGV